MIGYPHYNLFMSSNYWPDGSCFISIYSKILTHLFFELPSSLPKFPGHIDKHFLYDVHSHYKSTMLQVY